MRVVLSKNAVLLHLTLLVVFLASGYVRTSALSTSLPLLWLMIAVFQAVLLFPPALKGETIKASRERARRKLLRDPIFYVGLAGLLFFVVQALNGPCSFIYDAKTLAWRLTPPPLSGLPYCLDQSEAFQGFFWLGPAWTAILGLRHGLTRQAKLRLLHILALISGLVAIISLITYASGTPLLLWGAPALPHRYGIFEYDGFAGIFFAMMFFCSGGLLAQAITSGDSVIGRRFLYAATILNLIAATFSLNTGALLFVWGGGVIGFIYFCATVFAHVNGARRLRLAGGILLTVIILAFLHVAAYPQNVVHARVRAILDGTALQAIHGAEHATLVRGAWRVFAGHAAYGTGFWGYGRVIGQVLTEDDWRQIVSENQMPVTCHCDPLQFLAELGVVGSGLLWALIVLLAIPSVRQAYWLLRLPAAQVPTLTPARWRRFSPVAVGCALALGGAAVASFYDMPFRNPLVVLTWSLLLAILPSLLPVPKRVSTAAPVMESAPPARRGRLARLLVFRRKRRHTSHRH